MNEAVIRRAAEKCGITEIGFVGAEEFSRLDIKTRSAFAKKESMTDVFSVMPGAKSIIVYLVPYLSDKVGENLSAYALGEDYHRVCARISQKLCALLEEENYHARAFTDSGELSERALALCAGLGVRGKNGFVINEKYGSYTFISYIVTDFPFKPSQAQVGECTGCGKCIKSCPGGALGSSFDEEKCASYITQKKGELSEKEKEIIKKSASAWGCDICQRVCPMNKNALKTTLPPFTQNLTTKLEKEDISAREFKRKYSEKAFSWRGKAVIDRNLSILDEK